MNDQNPQTDETLDLQNNEVDELCGCPGKEKTRSHRIEKKFHEPWCFYYQHVADKMKEILKKWKEANDN